MGVQRGRRRVWSGNPARAYWMEIWLVALVTGDQILRVRTIRSGSTCLLASLKEANICTESRQCWVLEGFFFFSGTFSSYCRLKPKKYLFISLNNMFAVTLMLKNKIKSQPSSENGRAGEAEIKNQQSLREPWAPRTSSLESWQSWRLHTHHTQGLSHILSRRKFTRCSERTHGHMTVASGWIRLLGSRPRLLPTPHRPLLCFPKHLKLENSSREKTVPKE